MCHDRVTCLLGRFRSVKLHTAMCVNS
ncbi:hypothetical protein F383_02310 [Gossypium arboreum]|uniref:Uncharacterized protein n=1 Tax=Gossypium arboreum TaxID=29729 RepID=A0A0B0PC89_GOSAR|nr:hypothetical protein F383_02310 [Gossypium arboreum]